MIYVLLYLRYRRSVGLIASMVIAACVTASCAPGDNQEPMELRAAVLRLTGELLNQLDTNRQSLLAEVVMNMPAAFVNRLSDATPPLHSKARNIILIDTFIDGETGDMTTDGEFISQEMTSSIRSSSMYIAKPLDVRGSYGRFVHSSGNCQTCILQECRSQALSSLLLLNRCRDRRGRSARYGMALQH